MHLGCKKSRFFLPFFPHDVPHPFFAEVVACGGGGMGLHVRRAVPDEQQTVPADVPVAFLDDVWFSFHVVCEG